MHDLMQNLAIASVLLLNYILWTILFQFVSLYKVLLSVIKLFTGYLSAYHLDPRYAKPSYMILISNPRYAKPSYMISTGINHIEDLGQGNHTVT